MKKPVLLIAISMMIASLGFSQMLGPPDYSFAEKYENNVFKPMKADPPSTIDKYVSISADCVANGTCIIDYPRPLDNPTIKSTAPMILSKAQISVQGLPVDYLDNDDPAGSSTSSYRCIIVDHPSESPLTVRATPRLLCTAIYRGDHGF
jgi:hypothetical protein